MQGLPVKSSDTFKGVLDPIKDSDQLFTSCSFLVQQSLTAYQGSPSSRSGRLGVDNTSRSSPAGSSPAPAVLGIASYSLPCKFCLSLWRWFCLKRLRSASSSCVSRDKR